jgi:hypothetical protein
MTMQALATHARIIVLAVAVIALGTWHLVGMRPAQASAALELDTQSPLPMPELVNDQQTHPRADPPAADDQGGWSPLAAVTGGSQSSWLAVGSSDQDQDHVPPPVGSGVLDDVFAPDRLVRTPVESSSDVSLPDNEAVPGRGRPVPPAFSAPAAPGASAAESRTEPEKPRQANEKAYYEEYLALAKEDATALGHQVAAVLTPDGETVRQVALLRVLYDTDRIQALDHFTKAMALLPDVSRPSGVSVPVFAVGFLARQSGDPAAVALAERIAWGGHLNVSQEVRNAAANALLAQATPEDLQRYAAYPGFKPPMPESAEP